MFADLTKFDKKRTTNQAIGFYIAYLLIAIVVIMIIGSIVSFAPSNSDSNSFITGVRIGGAIAVGMSIGLAYLVIQGRKLSGDFKYILIGLLAGVLAYFGGALFGLIPVAYLTTINK